MRILWPSSQLSDISEMRRWCTEMANSLERTDFNFCFVEGESMKNPRLKTEEPTFEYLPPSFA